METLMQLAAPALTGFCSGFGAVVALKADVRWLKSSAEKVETKVDDINQRVSRLEGRG